MPRRLLALALLLGLLAATAGSAAAAPARPERGYLALGDSYAAGVGASAPATLGYTGRFAAYLAARSPAPPRLTNLAQPGATSADFIGDFPSRGWQGRSQLAQAARLLATRRDTLVTLDIGGNDVLHLLQPGQPCAKAALGSGPCLAAATSALETMTAPDLPFIVDALTLAAQPGTRLYVLTYPNPFSLGTGSALEAETDALTRALDAIIAGAVADAQPLARAFHVTVSTVDVFPAFEGRAAALTHLLGTPPDIHPNDAGYAVMAAVLEQAYAASLRQPPTAQRPATVV